MKKTLYFLLLFLIYACTEQSDLRPRTEDSSNPYQRSEQEALHIAANVLQSATHNTRAVNIGTLSIEPMLSQRRHTRLGAAPEADTAYFIVNAGDDKGFAFISGDKRQTPLLAFSDSGSLSAKDFEENPGLAIFKEKCEQDLVMLGDDGNSTAQTAPKSNPVYTNTWYTALETHIYRKGYVLWGQGSPYNDQALDKNGVKCPAGCIPTAISQLLAYYQHPKSIKGYTFDWDLLVYHRSKSIKSDLENYHRFPIEVATLFHKVGEVVEARYSPRGTPASHWKIEEAFDTFGYKKHDFAFPKDSADVIKQMLPYLQKGYPALMLGWLINGGPGHLWIADGWGKFVQVTVRGDKPGKQYWSKSSMDQIYFHMNWGWSGSNNGFFLASHYNIVDPKAIFDSDLRTGHNYNLGLDTRFWIFTPKQ